jgi:SAM-dependent methyltransferase
MGAGVRRPGATQSRAESRAPRRRREGAARESYPWKNYRDVRALRPAERFSDRVRDYVRARPSYPAAVLDVLREETGVGPAAVVSDLGSGTGISSALFLAAGYEVYAVEPNAAMREAAEAMHAGNPRFHSVAASAEETTLGSGSVDLVVAGQAFHWFDVDASRREFARILRGDRWVLLMWNTRRTEATAFLRAYEALLLEHGTDYGEVDHRRVHGAALRSVFEDGRFVRRVLPNVQLLDLDGLRARLLSSSYTPSEGDPRREPMLAALADIFAAHQQGGTVRVEYDTELYIGRVAP